MLAKEKTTKLRRKKKKKATKNKTKFNAKKEG
jgi:hypothetical protein